MAETIKTGDVVASLLPEDETKRFVVLAMDPIPADVDPKTKKKGVEVPAAQCREEYTKKVKMIPLSDLTVIASRA